LESFKAAQALKPKDAVITQVAERKILFVIIP